MSSKTLSIVLLSVAAVLVTAGQLSFKHALTKHPFERIADLPGLIFSAWAMFGFATYGAGAILWLYALSSMPFFVVSFFMVLPLALILVGAFFLWGERPNLAQWVGIATIFVGVVLVLWKSKT